MTKMILNGLLHFLLFMLTSTSMLPQPNLAADLQKDGKESRMDIRGLERPNFIRGLERPNLRCEDRRGVCVGKKVECPALLPEEDGTICPKKKKCCYPQPIITREVCQSDAGCHWSCATCECFCILPFVNNTWSEAESECSSRGWSLPHPIDAIALRSAIIQLKGNCDSLWLNAQYTVQTPLAGSGIRWQDDEQVLITDDNPLFAEMRSSGSYFPPPTPFPVGYCLELLASEKEWSYDVNYMINKPYGVQDCDSDVNHIHILCQRYY